MRRLVSLLCHILFCSVVLCLAGAALDKPTLPAGELGFYNREYLPMPELDTMLSLKKELSRRAFRSMLMDLEIQRAIKNHTGFPDNKLIIRPRI